MWESLKVLGGPMLAAVGLGQAQTVTAGRVSDSVAAPGGASGNSTNTPPTPAQAPSVPAADTILGMPRMVVYVGGGLVALGLLVWIIRK